MLGLMILNGVILHQQNKEGKSALQLMNAAKWFTSEQRRVITE